MKQISKGKTAFLLELNENIRTMTYLVALGTVFSLLAILTIPSVYADNQTIVIGDGEGCDKGVCLSTDRLIVTSGTTITWENQDKKIHAVNSGTSDMGKDGKYSSGTMLPGERFSYTFQVEGMYHFYCDAHPWMRGVILVA